MVAEEVFLFESRVAPEYRDSAINFKSLRLVSIYSLAELWFCGFLRNTINSDMFALEKTRNINRPLISH